MTGFHAAISWIERRFGCRPRFESVGQIQARTRKADEHAAVVGVDVEDAKLQTQREIGERLGRVVEQPQAAIAIAHHLAVCVQHASANWTGEPPVLEGGRGTVEERTEAGLDLRTDDRIRTRQNAAVEEIASASAKRNPRQHRVRRTQRRKQRWSGDVAIGRVVDPTEVVRHGVSHGIAHAHGSGVVMGRAQIVAAVLECTECRQSLGHGCRRALG